MNNRKHYQKVMHWLFFALFAIVVGFVVYGTYIYIYDHTERNYTVGEENNAFTVSIKPRSGKTDSWPKIITENGKEVTYNGTIYDVTLHNIGECNISKWDLNIDVETECFLNNAWCGKFEIHQNMDGNEKVQTVDLRNYDMDDLKIAYKMADPDLLISLNPGDTLVYHPDYETDEYPIIAGSNEKLTNVVFGMILYNKGNGPLTFKNYQVHYYLQKNYHKSIVFRGLCMSGIVWLILFIIFATIEANMKKVHLRFKQDEKIIRQSIGVFTQFFEAKDTYTNGHSQRVAKYAKMIAENMGFTDEECRQIYYIGLMHDCGKSYIPDSILKKPGKLSDEEYEIIKSHTVKGAEMLENFTAIEHMREGVLYHHERYDGDGYPSGLKGEEIPIISRIICVADSFDAMNSRRCYRDMLTWEYIIKELKVNSGKQFDPAVVDSLLELMKEKKIEDSSSDK